MLNRTFTAFWLFGLINNVLYVVILSAAVDLVGPLVPKATVLLADVLPSFSLKLTAPFFIHIIPYSYRIFVLIGLSMLGMVIVAFATETSWILFGIVLASSSSGLGELTFLQLTHYYGDISLSGFSSGTGGAGLVGSFVFLVLTTWMHISVKTTLVLFSAVPLVFFFSFFWLLPDPETVFLRSRQNGDFQLEEGYSGETSTLNFSLSGLRFDLDTLEKVRVHMALTLRRLRPLVFPYMFPLCSVYVAEYIINQGVSPTLLFPIEELPFKRYRDVYVSYGTLYQVGVFISRSSGPFVRIRKIYWPSILQAVNLAVCILQSIYFFIPNVYIMLVLVFYEGLLGGASYVNTFMLVSERTPLQDREFAMGAVGISDSAGIVLAASISMWLEPRLCNYQVNDGRPWCTMS
ncbi:unnamed protein product [Kuraishia capsulata CBS 1993]|uniref:Protein BTN n=1 Tax=Kuraishia capsulata CBS 1993 TaxID=1382522 RepID=W6MFY1_9ASCO|nr:uncharacterized protein KUCA_T00000532001 [Kuraishia capsulata CBS 1993]CDK24566.1 unnamed protein product [Kuraishia capsulata CBS 1993]